MTALGSLQKSLRRNCETEGGSADGVCLLDADGTFNATTLDTGLSDGEPAEVLWTAATSRRVCRLLCAARLFSIFGLLSEITARE